jgi:hypothetical protein
LLQRLSVTGILVYFLYQKKHATHSQKMLPSEININYKKTNHGNAAAGL